MVGLKDDTPQSFFNINYQLKLDHGGIERLTHIEIIDGSDPVKIGPWWD